MFKTSGGRRWNDKKKQWGQPGANSTVTVMGGKTDTAEILLERDMTRANIENTN